MNPRHFLFSLALAVLSLAMAPSALAAKSASCAHCHGEG